MALSPALLAWVKSRPEGVDACIEAALKKAMDTPRPDQVAATIAQVLRAQESQLTAALVAAVVGQSAGSGSVAPTVDPNASPWAPKPPPPPPVVNADTEAMLRQIEGRDPAVGKRAAALVRYPQLVEAVAKDLVSIERAEEMASEADARTKR